MKTSQWIGVLPAALILLATASGNVSAKETETSKDVYETGAHPRLSLRNINGSLTIQGWNKKEFEVTAVKTVGREEYLDDVEIRRNFDDDHLRIDVKYDDFDDDDENRWHNGSIVSVDFTIRVPYGTEIDAVELVNGDIEIKNVEGDVEVSSVNGEVSGEKLGGHVELATVNGEVSLRADGGVKSIRMHSVNGGVTLVLPKKFDARINAGTVHGSIRAIDGLDVDATKFTGSSMQGTIGKGGLNVDLNTVNGSIEIRHEGEGGSRDKE